MVSTCDRGIPFARFASILFSDLVRGLCRWYASFHSFHGHIRLQSSYIGGTGSPRPVGSLSGETWGRTGCLRDNCYYIIVVNIPSVTVCHAVNIPSVTVCRHRLSRAFFTMVLPGFPLFGALG